MEHVHHEDDDLPVPDQTDMSRSARIAGLRGFVTPTLEQVEHRRVELLLVVFAVALGLAVSLVLLSTSGTVSFSWLQRMGATGNVLRALVILLTVVFALYVFEKERHLRRLSRALMDEKVLTAALTSRLRDFSLLTEAGKAVLSHIELDDVLAVILRSASELLESDEGSVLLTETDEFVVAAATGPAADFIDHRRPVTQGLAGYVASRREPLLIETAREEMKVSWSIFPHEKTALSAMAVPLVAKGELLGVLNLTVTEGERRYTEHDLRALALFGEQAAVAVRHARVLNKERLLRTQLAEQDRIRNEMVGSMSHDLKSPLTVILGSAQLLLDAGDDIEDEQHDELVQSIEKQSKRLVHLVDQLLNAARSQAPAALVPTALDLVEHVNPLAASFLTAHERDIEVVAHGKRINAIGDPEAIDQVLSILLENACVHTPAGTSVVIELRQDEGRAEVRVIDDGPGIDPEILPNIFEPYRRGSARQRSGAGLGMFIASNLVRSMGGQMNVDSIPGRGATISFTLPALKARSSKVPA